MAIIGSSLLPIILLAILQLEPVVGYQQCPKGWSLYKNICYKLFTERKTWMQAKSSCENHRGHLVKIPSADIQNFVSKRIIRCKHKDVWIGLNDRVCDGLYYWTDNSKMTFNCWRGGNPNNIESQNCVHIYKNHNFGWADGSCEYPMHYVCQRAPELYCN